LTTSITIAPSDVSGATLVVEDDTADEEDDTSDESESLPPCTSAMTNRATARSPERTKKRCRVDENKGISV